MFHLQYVGVVELNMESFKREVGRREWNRSQSLLFYRKEDSDFVMKAKSEEWRRDVEAR